MCNLVVVRKESKKKDANTNLFVKVTVLAQKDFAEKQNNTNETSAVPFLITN